MKRSAPVSFLGMREAKKVDSLSLKLPKRPLSSPPVCPKEEQGIALTPRVPVVPLHSPVLDLLALLALLLTWERNGGGESESGVECKTGSLNSTGFCMVCLFGGGCFGNLIGY